MTPVSMSFCNGSAGTMPQTSLFSRQCVSSGLPRRGTRMTYSGPDLEFDGAILMSPLSPAYFAFAAIAITLYWACYRWKYARLSVLLLANIFFVARLARFYSAILLLAAPIDFFVGLALLHLP